jgi:cellulose synthase/poly-beta-1,6-N-acetylglucosamine synthase-like glycosyltransferase
MQISERACNLTDITVGVVAFNEGPSIARSLQSIQLAIQQVTVTVELIVVMTGCTDDTEAEASRVLGRDPHSRLISSPVRISKCAALNYLKFHSNGRILVCFDADLIVDRAAVKVFWEAYSNNSALAVAFGRMVPIPGRSTIWTRVGDWTAAVLDAIRGAPNGSGLWLICGSVFSVRADAWIQYPEDGIMSDDLYLGLVAQTRKLCVEYLPQAITYGRYPQTFRDCVAQKLRNRFAKIQLRQLPGGSFQHIPIWMIPFAIRNLGLEVRRHLPIVLIDGLLSAVALIQWKCGRRAGALWSQISSTKFD